ncbi:uncharacterized protein (DUF1501 family) [Inhella inkyongensis]|uniref:Uncharacterized protein (DUF1501 family) n=1 Tax=Inhella inkyongensis TaxID=392593 RepID=A0A840SCG5_9BURK|nr:DUF1501 domain-containing protein [Inhella inkyongensis]MBB5206019.1 uncharacterized protein (DUF1501 family) [Inhella inkyongensis]
MKLNRLPELRRREFLRRSAQLGLAGAAAPWALNLAAIGEAAAADASGGYKALVCVFLFGGNDYGSTLLPYDSAGHASLATLRGGLAGSGGLVAPRDTLAATALTPRVALSGSGAAGTQLAMAAEMSALKPLFESGRLGWLLNVGTLIQPTTKTQYQNRSVPLPPKLFSHNDQQSVWQSSGAEGSTKGWGGAIGDLFLGSNATSTFTCINASGNAVFMTGQQAVQYQVSTSGAVPVNGIQTSLYGSSACAQALRGLITAPRTHWMEAELSRVTNRSITAESAVKAALGTSAPFSTVFDSTSSLANQLQIVARLIAGRSSLGAQRQVFFVSLGGFDNHDFLLAQHPGLLAQVGNGLASFQAALTELGVADRVTTFTASDFGRTLTSNGDGSDHGWGSHHLVMGGAVQGQRFWGQMPVLANNGPDDVGQGRLLPSTSVDQLAATLARWMGVADSELASVVPNIANFSQRDLGFFTP